MQKNARSAEQSDVTNSVTAEQYQWLARQMLNRPNKDRLKKIILLSQHGRMPAQKKKALR